MGFFKDILFGKEPKQEVKQYDLHSDEQAEALPGVISGLETEYNSGGPKYTGPTRTGAIDLTNTSLAALEQAALNRANGQGATPLGAMSAEELMRLIQEGGRTTGFDDYYNNSVRDPMLKDFQNVLRQSGREFSGNSVFSSDRAQYEARAREDLLDSLTSARSDLAFQTQESASNRLMEALGLAQQWDDNAGNLLANAAVGRQEQSKLGLQQRSLDQADVQTDMTKWAQEQELKRQIATQLLEAVLTPTQENIVFNKPGTKGLLSSFIGGAGGGQPPQG